MSLQPRPLVLTGILCIMLFAVYLAGVTTITTNSPANGAVTTLLDGEEKLKIPQQAGVWRLDTPSKIFFALLGMRQVGSQRIMLCHRPQLLKAPKNRAQTKIIPIHIGHDWTSVENKARQNIKKHKKAHYGLKTVMLDNADFDIPALKITGTPNELHIHLSPIKQTFIADSILAGIYSINTEQTKPFNKEAWIIWSTRKKNLSASSLWLGNRALHLQRISDNKNTCTGQKLIATIFEADDATLRQQVTWSLYRIPTGLNQDQAFKQQNIAAGTQNLTAKTDIQAEDNTLFNHALEMELIKLGKHGAIQIAPKDLANIQALPPEFLVDKSITNKFSSIHWDKKTQTVLNDLYNRQVGLYVREQITLFNQQRMMAALRLKPVNDDAKRLLRQQDLTWQVKDNNALPLRTTETMPLQAGSLFRTLSREWQPWQRIENWPDTSGAQDLINYQTRLSTPATGKERFEIMLIGRIKQLKGAKVIQQEWRCQRLHCNSTSNLAQWSLIKLIPGATELHIQIHPESDPQVIQTLNRGEFRHIILNQQGQLKWRSGKKYRLKNHNDVTIVDRNGQVLWQNDKLQDSAKQAGLAALIGIDKRHESSLSGIFHRLPDSQVDAQLTLDLNLQILAQQALQQGLTEVSKQYLPKDPWLKERSAALLIMDADNGEILAAAGIPTIPDMPWQDLAGFDARKAELSSLRVRALHHAGYNNSRPGSTFKLLTSLMLEQQAKHNPTIDTLLQGVNEKTLKRSGARHNYHFNPKSGCYPDIRSTTCPWDNRTKKTTKPVIKNYGIKGRFFENVHRELNKQKESVYGLEAALRDSLNTWFAWLYEQTDQTLLGQGDIPGIADSLPLVPEAMDTARPIYPLLRQAGFGQALDLSAGLMPADFQWRTWDVLRSRPTLSETVENRHQLRQMAIGLRHMIAPLNIALVSASIASEYWVKPSLLKQLNHRNKPKPEFLPLAIRTDRIKAGMKRVPQDGSAKNTFADYAWLKKYLYAKTGTAPVQIKRHNHIFNTNTAWITGWLEASAIAAEPHRLAFVCQITHSKKTGGDSCGPVIRTFFIALKQHYSKTRQSPKKTPELAL